MGIRKVDRKKRLERPSRASSTLDPTDIAEIDVPQGPGGGRHGLILYVEDNQENWEVSYLALRRRFDMLWAKDDESACFLMSRYADDIVAILMDIELRGSQLDGIALTRLFRGTLRSEFVPSYASVVPIFSKPIFFVTAYASRYTELQLMEAGGDRCLAKPVDFAQLSLALTELEIQNPTSETGLFAVRLARGNIAADALRALLECLPELGDRIIRVGEVGFHDYRGAPTAEQMLHNVGPDALRDTLLALATIDLAPPSRANRRLFSSVIHRAAAAELVGAVLTPSTPRRKSTILGLLLECGLLARSRHDLRGALEIAGTPSQHRPVRERAAQEVAHPKRGAQIARDWSLDSDMVLAITHHHDDSPARHPLAAVAWLSERLAAVYEEGDVAALYAAALRAGETVGLTDSHEIDDMLESLPTRAAALAAALGVDYEPPAKVSEILKQSSDRLASLGRAYNDLMTALDAIVGEKEALLMRLSAANRLLAQEASRDPLTGIANRRTLEITLRRDLARARRNSQGMCLLMIDLDNFKYINDSYGHQAGDDALQCAATALTSAVRGGDLVARHGGDEFIVLLSECELEMGMRIAERIRSDLEHASLSLPGQEQARITGSVGLLWIGKEQAESSPQEIISRCDENLYEAKRRGRNCVVGTRA